MARKSLHVLLVYPNLMLQTMYPMGLAILSAVLKRHGHTVDAFDTTFYRTDEKAPHEYCLENLSLRPFSEDFQEAQQKSLRPRENMVKDFRARVRELGPDLVAVSAVEDTFPIALELLEGIRDFKVPNLVGGVFPTFAPEKAIRESVVDMISVGEGEGPLLDLCDAMAEGRDPSGIGNLWVKRPGGAIVRNPMRPVVELDSLPMPDYSLLDNQRFYFTTKAQGKLLSSASVETARGCPYKCTFCNSPAQLSLYSGAGAGHFFRLKSVELVRKELLALKNDHQVEYVYFPADTFLAIPNSYLYELAEAYEDVRLPFWCQTRSETLTPERVEILKKMGCQNVSIGLEHGNEKFRRDILLRDYSNESFVENVKLLRDTGIEVTLNCILGFPTETPELTWDTIRLVRRVVDVAHTINVFHFVPYHGTRLRDLALEKGYITDETRVEHNFKDTVLDMPEYPRDRIRGMVRSFLMYVRFPESEYDRITQAQRTGEKALAGLRQEFVERFYSESSLETHYLP